MKFLTFGEIMLRLKAPGQECFFQSPMLEATFGGGEANVAVSLANYGEDAAFLTVLPDNAIADACKAELRRFDVDTKRIVTGEGRMGIYYLEGGANQRPSKVVYDRAWSAIALAKPGDIDWDNSVLCSLPALRSVSAAWRFADSAGLRAFLGDCRSVCRTNRGTCFSRLAAEPHLL